MTPQERIAKLERRLSSLRRIHADLKTEMAGIDKKKKRARNKQKAREGTLCFASVVCGFIGVEAGMITPDLSSCSWLSVIELCKHFKVHAHVS